MSPGPDADRGRLQFLRIPPSPAASAAQHSEPRHLSLPSLCQQVPVRGWVGETDGAGPSTEDGDTRGQSQDGDVVSGQDVVLPLPLVPSRVEVYRGYRERPVSRLSHSVGDRQVDPDIGRSEASAGGGAAFPGTLPAGGQEELAGTTAVLVTVGPETMGGRQNMTAGDQDSTAVGTETWTEEHLEHIFTNYVKLMSRSTQ